MIIVYLSIINIDNVLDQQKVRLVAKMIHTTAGIR